MLRAGDVRTLLTRYSDLALAGMVVAIVGMMIVPLPTPLLDLLISVNIAAGVVLLLVAIYVSDAVKIATFPTLLLLATLFRLAESPETGSGLTEDGIRGSTKADAVSPPDRFVST